MHCDLKPNNRYVQSEITFMCSRLEHAKARVFNGQHYFGHDIYNKRRLMQVEQLTVKTVLQTAHKHKTATSVYHAVFIYL